MNLSLWILNNGQINESRLSDLPDPERKKIKKFFKGLETRGKTVTRKATTRPSSPKSKASKAKGSASGRASMRKRAGRTRR